MAAPELDETAIVNAFLANHFTPTEEVHSEKISEEERAVVVQILEYVSSRFKRMKYILGTAIDFTLLAEALSKSESSLAKFREDFSVDDFHQTFNVIEKKGDKVANTLSVLHHGKEHGIRKIEDQIIVLFRGQLKRSNYPSSPVFATGQWRKFQDLLALCFKLAGPGRFLTVNELLKFGLNNLEVNTFYSRPIARPIVFEAIVTDYPRSAKGENGGLVFQAIAFGYVTADRAHLSITADKVRTGSSRQKRFGDIDCYSGLDLELSVEVKDLEITLKNKDKELGAFINAVTENETKGVAFVREITADALTNLGDQGIGVLTETDLLNQIALWDWQKQEKAVQGMLHYIAHVEQDVLAVKRLLEFIEEIDPEHDSLVFLER